MVAQPQIDTLPDWKQRLADRGILETALECGWTLCEIYGTEGWSFPLRQFNGAYFMAGDKKAMRWKACDRVTAPNAYLWLTGDKKKPANCSYYWWGAGTQEAIENDWNTLYITAGEPDMLSMLAAGHRNVTSFFGEKIIPDTLAADLQRIKVFKVIYLTDMDNAGVEAAQTILKQLDGVMACDVKRLPREFNGKVIKDINDLWVATGFNKELFDAQIDSAPLWKFGEPLKAYYDFDAFKQAVDDAMIQRTGIKKRKGHNWSENVPCIFHGDDKHPSAGYNFDTHTFYCFTCGQSWNAETLANELGVDKEQFNENAGKLRFYDGEVKADKPAEKAVPLAEMFVSSDTSLLRYRERLDGLHISDITAAPFPFTILHHLTGFCEILKPRKMVGIIGLSGGGKTSFIESMIDILRQAGDFHTLWWGKEWTWEEMADRAVQRQGGLTMMQMANYEMHLAALKTKGVSNLDKGKLAKIEGLIERSKEITHEIEAWKGKAFYIDKSTDLETTLQQSQVFLDQKKAEGIRIRVAAWDYVSLFFVKGARTDLETITRGLQMVKDFGEANELFTFVASQPRKGDATQVKDGEKMLTAEDALYANDHKFNLMLTLNPQYIEGVMQDWGIINVVKNSGGRCDKVSVQMDLKRLRWLDQKPHDGWTPQ